MANCRKLSPLARDLLERVQERGEAFSTSFEYRGAAGTQAKVKRAADQLLRCGFVLVNMAPSGWKRGIWQIVKRGQTL